MTWGWRQREFRQRGLDMEELTLSIPARPPMTSRILFRLKSQEKKKDEQSFNTFLTFFFVLQQQYRGNKRTLFTLLHLKPLLKISTYNCIISPKVSWPRASTKCQNASLLPKARVSEKPQQTLRQNAWMVAEAQLSGFKSAFVSMAVYVTGATKGTERNCASL